MKIVREIERKNKLRMKEIRIFRIINLNFKLKYKKRTKSSLPILLLACEKDKHFYQILIIFLSFIE